VMVIVMAVVFGMSAGVMADDTLGEEILDVGLIINQYTEIDISDAMARPDATDNLVENDGVPYLNLAELNDPNNHVIGWELEVKSNANVDITVAETVSKKLKDEGMKVWAFDEEDWVVAPNVELFKDFGSSWGSYEEAATETGSNSNGRYEKISNVEGFNDIVAFGAQVNEEGFEEAKKGEYTGEIIVTVESAE
ncbi:MAG: hypothetical protein ACLFQ4_09120, partial [Halanaerobium sp.]